MKIRTPNVALISVLCIKQKRNEGSKEHIHVVATVGKSALMYSNTLSFDDNRQEARGNLNTMVPIRTTIKTAPNSSEDFKDREL